MKEQTLFKYKLIEVVKKTEQNNLFLVHFKFSNPISDNYQ